MTRPDPGGEEIVEHWESGHPLRSDKSDFVADGSMDSASGVDLPATSVLIDLLLEQGQEHALFFMTPDGAVTDWFNGAVRIFGFDAAEMIGGSAVRLFNQEDIERGAPANEMQMAIAAGHSEDERWHVRKDASLFWGSGSLLALRDSKGELIGFAKIVRNRTDLKTHMDALESQSSALSKTLDKHKNFVASAVHELRNPLAPLRNAVAILGSPGNVTPGSEGSLGIMRRQVDILARVVDDLMDMIRVGAGKIELSVEIVDLRDIVRAVVESVQTLAAARQQQLSMISIPSPVLVKADPLRLHQVFANLLNNAIKYTPQRGRIIVNVTTEGNDAVGRVEDNGVGMDADILPVIFELFTQEVSSRSISRGGLGLGLALVRDFVELHSGTVDARSDGRDKGSVFTVRLPLCG